MSEPVHEKSHMDSEKGSVSQSEDVSRSSDEDIDFDKYQMQMAGRLVVDPECVLFPTVVGTSSHSVLIYSQRGKNRVWGCCCRSSETLEGWQKGALAPAYGHA